jgi:3-oxoadipate enol-lactonase
MPVVSAGEVELSYERSGSGPPLLLIMGMSATARHWGEPFLTELRRDFEVIVYDHRGIGNSSWVEGQFTIAQLAEDAAGLLTALELDSAHVMGISMGGMVAQELALMHPERVRTLILGCTYCGGEDSLFPAQPELAEAVMSGDRERAMRATWEINVSARMAENADAYAAFRAIGLERSVALLVMMEQLAAISGHDTSTRLPQLRTSTLIVHGDVDVVLPVHNGRLIAEHMPGARLEIFEDVGHFFFWEQPERTAALVREHAAIHA